MQYRGQSKAIHDRYQPRRTGLLLTNLGTPEAPTAEALRPYLKQFLSDPRVIELPKWKWWPILNGIILRVRPAKSAALYRSIWTDQGSPLMKIGLDQTQKMAHLLNSEGHSHVEVKLAMRYGQPSIGQALQAFQDEGINRLIVLPLYPQYSGATGASTFDAVVSELGRWRWTPELHFINSYHDNPLYIQALANSVRQHIAQYGQPDKLMMSFHGMPQRYFDQGDPYYCFCQKTSRLLAEQLGMHKDQYLTCFQSRFGREPWLQPYTDETLTRLASEGVKHVAVICPGFSADCLETIEEIAEENQETFKEAGGETYHYIPALNDRDEHMRALYSVVQRYL